MLTNEELLQMAILLKEQEQQRLNEQVERDNEYSRNRELEIRDRLIYNMKQEGYSGEGSEEDFKRFLNKPEWFGENWERQATDLAKQSNCKDLFIDYYLRYGEH